MGFRESWQRASWKVKGAVVGGGAVALITVIGSFGGGSADTPATTDAEPTLTERGATATPTVGVQGLFATTQPSAAEGPPAAAPANTPTAAPTATAVPPTATPVPPTATPIPPTSTPVPPTAIPTSTPPPQPPTPTATSAPTCDPNYSGACIPIVGFDLDCGDVGVKRFRVVGVDRHGFDGDNDGIACES